MKIRNKKKISNEISYKFINTRNSQPLVTSLNQWTCTSEQSFSGQGRIDDGWFPSWLQFIDLDHLVTVCYNLPNRLEGFCRASFRPINTIDTPRKYFVPSNRIPLHWPKSNDERTRFIRNKDKRKSRKEVEKVRLIMKFNFCFQISMNVFGQRGEKIISGVK